MNDYFAVRPHIRDGDLIAVRGRGAFAAAIVLVTGSPYTHTGVAVWFGERLLVAETRGGVAAFSPLSQHHDDDFDVYGCPVNPRDCVWSAQAMLGEVIRYDYTDLLRIAAHKRLGVQLPSRDDGEMVCSALSAAIYLQAGWQPAGLPSIPAPCDVVAALGSAPRIVVRPTR